MVNSSFEYFPGIPIFESADGDKWERVGNVMTRPSQFPYDTMGNNQGVYAPTIRFQKGTYYVIVTNVNVGAMIYTTCDPYGEWSDPMLIPGWPGIDPSLLFDDSAACDDGAGQVYICGNGNGVDESEGIYAARIDVRTGEILSPRVCLTHGITGSNPEGPHMYRRDGAYYLMWAEGGTESGHMENIARSQSPLGPYEMYDGNPLITNRSTRLTLQAIGHCDIEDIESDRSLMVFHGTRNNDEYPVQGWIGREPYAVRFGWVNGWPDLSDQSYDCPLLGSGDSLEKDVELITPGKDTAGRFRVTAVTCPDDGFPTGPELGDSGDTTDAIPTAMCSEKHQISGEQEACCDTARKRNPSSGNGLSIRTGNTETTSMESVGLKATGSGIPGARTNGMRINGSGTDSTETACRPSLETTITVTPSQQDFDLLQGAPLIGTRQTDFMFEFGAELPDLSAMDCSEFGLVVYANAEHYMTLAVHVMSDNGSEPGRRRPARLETRVMNAGLVSVVDSRTLPQDSPLKLHICGNDRKYIFKAVVAPETDSMESQVVLDMGTVPGKVLSFVNAGGFTGIVLGVYAHGAGQAVTFEHVRYQANGPGVRAS
jgi:beta-xylosidase